jgi:hypothetical protein
METCLIYACIAKRSRLMLRASRIPTAQPTLFARHSRESAIQFDQLRTTLKARVACNSRRIPSDL